MTLVKTMCTKCLGTREVKEDRCGEIVTVECPACKGKGFVLNEGETK